MTYAAIISLPVTKLGVRCLGDTALLGLDFLPPLQAGLEPAPGSLAGEVTRQLTCWLTDPRFVFDLPLATGGSAFQRRVWQAIAEVPCATVISYQTLAERVGSVARAVGGACGRNPLPIIVPCHRIVAKHGLGGFNLSRGDAMLDVKRWLLEHERANG